MKCLWLGIKDYTKDCWHDFWFKFWNALWDFTRRRACKCYVWRNNEGLLVKEGSVWHYIRQRKIGNKVKKGKTMSRSVGFIFLFALVAWAIIMFVKATYGE